MQTASFKNWTLIVVTIFYDDKYYNTNVVFNTETDYPRTL